MLLVREKSCCPAVDTPWAGLGAEMNIRIALLVAIFVVCDHQASAQGQTLSGLIEANDRFLGGIKTFQTTYKIEQKSESGQWLPYQSGRYFRSGARIMHIESPSSASSSYVLTENGETRSLLQTSQNGTVRYPGATKSAAVTLNHLGEIFVQFHVDGFAGPTQRRLSLRELYTSF